MFICSDIESYIIAGPDSLVTTGIGENIYVAKYKNTITIPDTTYQHNDTSICSSGTDSITILAPRGYTNYYWSDSTVDSFHTFHTAGTYWVYCVTCGDPVLVDTFHLSDTGVVDTITTRHNAHICMLSDIPVPVIESAPAGGIHYLWSNGDTSVLDTISYPGTYWVSYISHCTLHVDTFVVSAAIQPQPIAGRDSICVGDYITLSDATPGGIWSSSNTSIASIDSISGITAGIADGIDTIKYLIADGCYTSRKETVLAPPCVNAVAQIPAQGNEVCLFPVPAKNELVIKMANAGYSAVVISDLLGQSLISEDIKTLQTVVNISKLPSGLYYVTLKGHNGILTKKFVKE